MNVAVDTAGSLEIRWWGRSEYCDVWDAMRAYTDGRDTSTPDQLWLVEHDPVFTLGLNGRREHILSPGRIPVVHVDRGGQVTFHGPGQVVVYTLIDLKRRGLGVRPLVSLLERSVIEWLAVLGIRAEAREKAPGVYVDDRKIASVGLRVRRGCSYHGLAFNNAMDLEPFSRIHPCGFRGLEVTDLRSLGVSLDWQEAAQGLCGRLTGELEYTDAPAGESSISRGVDG